MRRNNAIARVNPTAVIFADLRKSADKALAPYIPTLRLKRCDAHDVDEFASDEIRAKEPLKWGQDRIGIGVLKALREGRLIEFRNGPSTTENMSANSNHLVICEAGEPLAEVIAANYAFALDAGLHLIDAIPQKLAEDVLEQFYSIDDVGGSPREVRVALQGQLRDLCGQPAIPDGGSITIFSRRLPLGVGFSEVPSTHLATYPDLGICIINGFAAEQQGTRGVNIGVIVDPEKTSAPEIAAARRLLPLRSMFVRGYQGKGATVRAVADMVDLFPFDLLIFATHCGDTPGYRWTYEYTDSEKRQRRLVVDIGLGVAQTEDPEILEVMKFISFHSLDGVDWSDPVAKAKLYVGKAIVDYMELERANAIEPVEKATISRVRHSAAMAMSDNTYIPMPRALADHGSPIIINNACASWHELAGRFTFANARAYIGTLYPVTDAEAESVIVGVLDKHWGKLLPHAIWAAQNATYGKNGDRRPYIVTGVYPQRLRTTKENVPLTIMRSLLRGWAKWNKNLKEAGNDSARAKKIQPFLDYYEEEANAFKAKWFGLNR